MRSTFIQHCLRGQVAAIILAALLAGSSAAPQERDTPLPELKEFLADVRKHLRSDRLLLSQYTYTVRSTEHHLDRNGSVKKTEVKVYEVYPSLEDEMTYRRLISKNGTPVSRKELEKQDRKHEKKVRERAARLEREGTMAREKRLAKEAEEFRKEEEEIDELFQLYEFELQGRAEIDGTSTIAVDFTPRSNFRARSDAAKILKKISGRAWVCEEDRQVVRIEAKLIENLGIGMGILARLQKGANMTFQRRRVNDEIWLPAEAHFQGVGRLLLFKGLRLDSMSQFSDYRKFTVGTSISYPGIQDPR